MPPRRRHHRRAVAGQRHPQSATHGLDGGGPDFDIELAAASNTEVVRAKRKATAEEKAVIGRNQLKRMLLGMGKYATNKVQPNGKVYCRAAGRQSVRAALQGA